MISDARGGHVSPGVYTEEKDVLYSAKSLGITSLGLAGETLKGPAFEPIQISDWSEFVDYFGGTSPEKFKGNGIPKYQLPYVAKSYLNESRNLTVVRALGLAGYNAGPAWVFKDEGDMPVIILRSKMKKGAIAADPSNPCPEYDSDMFTPRVTAIEMSDYNTMVFDANCVKITDATDEESGEYRFGIDVTYDDGKKTHYNLSMESTDTDYIYSVLPSNPLEGQAPLYIEAVYDYAWSANGATSLSILDSAGTKTGSVEDIVEDYTDYKEPFRCAQTPWIVSNAKGANVDSVEVKKLFKFYTISDGNAANYQVKVSIQNIKPDEGTFDVVVRDFYDNDAAPVVLEKFSKCTMVDGDASFIGIKIGTYDGGYPARSKYITVKMAESEGIESSVPAGFLGYPMPTYGNASGDHITMAYNTTFDSTIKARRQYFGLNTDILDVDVLNYKGVSAYNSDDDDPRFLSNGFHLDALLGEAPDFEMYSDPAELPWPSTVYVDGVSGFNFTTVDATQVSAAYTRIPRILNERYMEDTIYDDVRVRKFTVYPYGGFDGWNIFETQRSTGDKYKASNYTVKDASTYQYATGEESVLNATVDLNLPKNSITSDYYAYLGAIRQFANPQDIDINIFATPGINWSDNTLLVEEAIEMIEDFEDGRNGDAIYVIDAPQYNEYGEIIDTQELIEALDETDINTSYACTYYPWVKYYDASNKKYLDLPVTKDVVRNMAATDNTAYPWFTPAGIERGPVDCIKAYKKTTLSDEDDLYESSINPVKSFAIDGVKVWGNKTLYKAESPLNRINVRRLMLRVKKLVTEASKGLIFEQYDASLEKQFRSLVEPILADVKSNRGIIDYRILTECTPETRDQHILPAKILVKPTQALEYISISFVVSPESVSFDEN